VAQATADAIVLCEAAGYQIVIVETVGVGQSEVSVRDIVDCMVLLVPPGGGDELQGLKKGIVELCDFVVVNKADGDMLARARHTKVEYMHALQMLDRGSYLGWAPRVLLSSTLQPCSAKESIVGVWRAVEEHHTYLERAKSGIVLFRTQQRRRCLWKQIEEEFATRVKNDACLNRVLLNLEETVGRGIATPRQAAETFLDELRL
jgi:LAO/AO transport system kinase